MKEETLKSQLHGHLPSLGHTSFYYIIQMPTAPFFSQIGQFICNFAVIIICQFPHYLVLGHFFWECSPPTSSPPPLPLPLTLTLWHYPEALKRKVGGCGLAGRGGSLQGTVIYLDCYLKSIGDERGGWGNHPRKIFQHKIVQQTNNNTQQNLMQKKREKKPVDDNWVKTH
jgi:hypothetical protein